MIKIYSKLKKFRRVFLFFYDFFLWNISFYFSFAISRYRFSLKSDEQEFFVGILFLNVCFCTTFLVFKLYNKMWRYAEIEDFFYVEIAIIIANFVFLLIMFLIGVNLGFRTHVLTLLMSSFFIFVFRVTCRLSKILESRHNIRGNTKTLLLVGAGETTLSILQEIHKSPNNEYTPVGIVDDDETKLNRSISGVKVLGKTLQIPEICEEQNVQVILFSVSAISRENKKRILDICSKTSAEVKIIPNISNLLTSNSSLFSRIRPVEVEDLLVRNPITFDIEKYGRYIFGKNVLVTGGGGSIGSELCKQIAALKSKKIIILDICENGVYKIQQELLRKDSNLNLSVKVASVTDLKRLENIFREEKIDAVFHAAAHKHVPLMELNPSEAVQNNIFGTLNLVILADKYKIKKFVQISTDKAVNPTNIMGATKRICEMIVQNFAEQSQTKFAAVRFGNVLDSNGSVVPLFKEQIKEGGPVTVTHPDIIRYFMTIPEAVSLVLTAGSMAMGGEIFILDMGEPMKIRDLAQNLIRLSGFVPDQDIEIKFTGLRPGEKLYEELLLNEEGIKKTKNKKIYVGRPLEFNKEKFFKNLEKLKKFSDVGDNSKIEFLLKEIVPNFKHTSLV
ncbi:MAG: polysaccharide biosynthesis protein [Oscillospiraceae bacterium]|jgi:FlaA1/EpsC-like NDP-sugar epimerase|nr:polysaccharide biosynthesis protein [Oscillospiraceae bacterium]